ncbi:MAG: hypothetical protein LBM87_03850 [Ruminococcus sp.]|jgi:hypothetical protein|nr:hypothetical protein [Ruminococcus sp.]
MQKFKQLIKNKWFINGISLLGIFFPWFLLYAVYMVFFYDIEYTNRVMFAILYVLFVFVSGFIFFYTRKTFITKLISIVNLVLMFPILLLDWGNFPLIIPAMLISLFLFFASGLNPTAKTIFGTIILLVYIVGSVAFYFVWYVFRTTTEDTLTEVVNSPSGNFAAYVVDVKNKSTGKIDVFVEPIGVDREAFGCIELKTTLKKRVKQTVKPQGYVETETIIEWKGNHLYIDGKNFFDETRYRTEDDTEFKLDDGSWTYTYFEIDYPISTLIERVTDIAKTAVDKLTQAE